MSSYFHTESSFQIGPDRLTWAVRMMLLANIVVFICQLLLRIPDEGRAFFLGEYTQEYLAFSPRRLLQGFVWQPISYMFMHGSLSHLFQNMLGLYFFGSEVERTLGSRQFIRFYLLCGALGVMANFAPMLWQAGQIPDVNVVGASGAVMGVLVAFAILQPDRKIVLFPIPIPITARAMIIIFIALNLMSATSPGSNTSVATHFGGMIIAFIYIKVRPKVAAWQIKRIRSKRKPADDAEDLADAIDNIFKFQDKDRR